MTDPRIGDTVHYHAGIANIGTPTYVDDHPDARCQAAIIVHIEGPTTVLLSVYGDIGWEAQADVPADPANGWEDYTPGTWHHIH